MISSSNQPVIKNTPPLFEGFVIKALRPGQISKIRKAVKHVLGAGWVVRTFGDDETDFEVVSAAKKGSRMNPRRVWEKTYQLRARPDVAYVEPMFTVPVSGPPKFRAQAVERRDGRPAAILPTERSPESAMGLIGDQDLSESDDPQWSIKAVKALEAWQRFPAGTEPGSHVIIGHPDTGYSEHPEILPRLLTKKGFDFVKNDSDALDELNRGLLLFPGHGTGTSSVIVSPQGAQSDFGSSGNNSLAVWGVAPGANLIPLRVSRSVVLDVFWAGGGVLNLAKAIELATDKGAHVVSISMGTGFPNARLLKALQYAQKRGVIVLAAAGNYVGFVVWPAAYEEVIAVAASNAQNKTWKHSSHGSAVDVTAPGESVWCAGVERAGVFTIGRGSGTSYAVATTAGVAALWLSHHGREKLVQRYGAEKIPLIFNKILRDSCDPLTGAGSGFGRGLVNAEKVLAAALPDGVLEPIPLASFVLSDQPSIDAGGVATFRHLFESAAPVTSSPMAATPTVSDTQLRARLSELLGVRDEQLNGRLKEVGQELAFNFAADPKLYARFAATLSTEGASSGAAHDAAPVSSLAPTTIEDVRSELMLKDTSKALKR